MKLYIILFTLILLIGLCTSSEEFHHRRSLQDYVDRLVDANKFRLKGMSSINDTTIRKIWSYFKAKYHRLYSSTGEEKARLRIFVNRLKYVLKSNFEKSRTFQLGLNEFSDRTSAEFKIMKSDATIPPKLLRDLIDDERDEDILQRTLAKLYQRHHDSKRLKQDSIKRRYKDKLFFKRNNNDTNEQMNAFDWRTKNVVTSVKHQGQCGSCYAFATTAVLESVYAIKENSGNVNDFSPQQIVDCSSGNGGCNGGNIVYSIDYLTEKDDKIATETSYPYANTKQSCRTDIATEVDLGHMELINIPVDEKKLAEALIEYGPIYIHFDARSDAIDNYRTGIYNLDSCSSDPEDLNHAVVIVGYGYDEEYKKSYWILKNSWGTGWGENGYFRLLKDAGNMCGVASVAFAVKLI